MELVLKMALGGSVHDIGSIIIIIWTLLIYIMFVHSWSIQWVKGYKDKETRFLN